jgi:hypothetical protein
MSGREPPGENRAVTDVGTSGAEYDTSGLSRPDGKTERLRYRPPGDVPEGHPGLTKRVLAAVARARPYPRAAHPITDDDGPHRHHWEPIPWWCRGCGAFDE